MGGDIGERVAVLEAKIGMMESMMREMKEDIRWIRENMAKRDEMVRLSQRVNGISQDVAENRGMRDYVKIIIQWLIQGGVMGGCVVVIVKMVLGI